MSSMLQNFTRSTGYLGLGLLLFAGSASAQSATQVVRFQVNAVSQVAVHGAPAPMVINSAVPGSAPTAVTANGGTWSVTTNEEQQKLTASLDEGLPSGVSLEVQMAAPTGASSTGLVSLSTSSSDVVTGISTIAATALPISYRLSATSTVRMTSPATRTVRFTIVSGT